jgi:hypothetical protein
VVATFTSTYLGNTAADFTATIDWGDHSPLDAGVVTAVAGQPGHFTVSTASNGGHTYADELSGKITVTIRDDTPGTATAVAQTSFTVTEADVLTAAGASSFSVPEGQGVGGNAVVATFTSTYLGNTAADFTATINWGDGSPLDAGVVTAVAGQPGSYTVSTASNGGHTYADELSTTITVTISDDKPGTATALAQTSVTVTEADQLTAPGVQALTIAEGQGLGGNALVATFTSTYLGNAASDFTATIDWGDGTTSPGIVAAVAGQPGHFTVSTAANDGHFYADEANADELPVGPIVVTISDDKPGTATVQAQTPVTVTDLPVNALGGFEVTATEGVPFAGPPWLLATFTDPGGAEPNAADALPATVAGHYSASIDWGDGTSGVGVITYNPNTRVFSVTGGHTYFEEPSPPYVTVKIYHESLIPVVVIDKAVVADPAVLGTGVNFNATESIPFPFPGQTVATFIDPSLTGAEPNAFDDPGGKVSDHYGALIDWGDKTKPTVGVVAFDAASGTFSVLGDHTYALQGTFTVTVHLDHEGVPSTAVGTAVVGASLSGTGLTFNVLEGAPTNGQVALFTSLRPNNGPHDFTALIDWGDGSVTPGVLTGSNGTYAVTGGGDHVYAGEGTFTVVVAVTDHILGSTATTQGQATVGEADTLTGAPAAAINGETGVPLTGVTVATFTSSFAGNAATDFTATIDWGDGAVNPGTITGSNGKFTVTGTHTYEAAGSFALTVTVRDAAPGTAVLVIKGTTAGILEAVAVPATNDGTLAAASGLLASAPAGGAVAAAVAAGQGGAPAVLSALPSITVLVGGSTTFLSTGGVGLSSLPVVANSPVGSVVGSLSLGDLGSGGYTFELAPGGPDNALFTIDGNTLRTAAALTVPGRTYTILVRVTDGSGRSAERLVQVVVTPAKSPPEESNLDDDSTDYIYDGGQPGDVLPGDADDPSGAVMDGSPDADAPADAADAAAGAVAE